MDTYTHTHFLSTKAHTYLKFKWIYSSFFRLTISKAPGIHMLRAPSMKPKTRKFVQKCSKPRSTNLFLRVTLAVCLGGVVALVHNKILGLVVFPAREV